MPSISTPDAAVDQPGCHDLLRLATFPARVKAASAGCFRASGRPFGWSDAPLMIVGACARELVTA